MSCSAGHRHSSYAIRPLWSDGRETTLGGSGLSPARSRPIRRNAHSAAEDALTAAQAAGTRFSREGVLETLQHLQRLSSYGVEWFSYREDYLRSVGVFKEAVLAILATIAKQERIRLSERVHAGLSRARAQGKVLGRPKAAVRPERVLRMRERGLSIRAIAEQTGVSAMTVQRILAQE